MNNNEMPKIPFKVMMKIVLFVIVTRMWELVTLVDEGINSFFKRWDD